MSANGDRQRKAPDPNQDEWMTPRSLVAGIEGVLHTKFTLDPCASIIDVGNKVRANAVCLLPAACACGLCSSWADQVAFVNPPYGRALPTWIHKCINEAARAQLIVALVPNATDANWFARAHETAAAIWLPRGRARFVHPVTGVGNRNTRGSAIIVWANKRPTSARVLSRALLASEQCEVICNDLRNIVAQQGTMI